MGIFKSKLYNQKYTKNHLISKIHTVWNEILNERIKKMRINIWENSTMHWCGRKIKNILNIKNVFNKIDFLMKIGRVSCQKVIIAIKNCSYFVQKFKNFEFEE